MKKRLAIVKNVLSLQLAYESLASRDVGIPGMGLVHGFTGAGKTTAIAWLVNQTNSVYVRAQAAWTPTAMLGSIMRELSAQPLGSRQGSALMVAHIIEALGGASRALFVDEGDYLFQNLRMLETLRDIHDCAGVPVVIIGMEGIERRMTHRRQLARRISQWVQFLPADLADARTLADTVCEVDIDDDLLSVIHAEARGNVGLMTVGLARVEALAKANDWDRVCATQWGRRQLFLTGTTTVTRQAA